MPPGGMSAGVSVLDPLADARWDELVAQPRILEFDRIRRGESRGGSAIVAAAVNASGRRPVPLCFM